jgi:hypothetical protein
MRRQINMNRAFVEAEVARIIEGFDRMRLEGQHAREPFAETRKTVSNWILRVHAVIQSVVGQTTSKLID